jgi:hypothetical protein
MMDVLAHTIIEVSVQNQGLLVGFDAFCDFSIGLMDFWKCSGSVVCGLLFNIVAVSFIGGGNQKTRRKPPNCCKSQANLIT